MALGAVKAKGTTEQQTNPKISAAGPHLQKILQTATMP
jgi:hypothetical protein